MQPAPPSFPGSQLDVRFTDGVDPAATPYTVISMYTSQYRAKADRLMASCVEHGLPLALFETPAVHQSMSVRGGADLSLTKSSLIQYALQRFEKPVLYVDSDMVFHDRPHRVDEIAGSVDLAIYNWLADPCTDVWHPVPMPWAQDAEPRRFWAFDYTIDQYDPAQLMCTGMTQLWGQGPAAHHLLTDWQAMIEAYPTVADDECLDYTFNTRDNAGLRCEWLEKSYARIPGWPHIRPVIAHPDPVSRQAAAAHIEDFIHGPRIDPTRAPGRPPPPTTFPRNAILDTEEGDVLMPIGEAQQLVRVGRLTTPFWF